MVGHDWAGVLARIRHPSFIRKSIPRYQLYAGIYFLLIPLFAAIYYFLLPMDFYHSTAQYEYGPMSRAADRIFDEIHQSILENLQSPTTGSLCGQWQIDRHHLRPYALQVDGNDVTFSLRVIISSDGKYGRSEEHIPLQIAFSLHPMIRTWPSNNSGPVDHFEVRHPRDTYKPAFNGDLGSDGLLACIFPASTGSPAFPSGMMIHIPSTLTGELVKFSNARRGFPAQLDGQFVRMLYLSATTITTLGFGDIVPLTTPARITVSLEAVFGIALMGLFVNAVTDKKPKP